MTCYYDDSNLRKLFKALDQEQRVKAMKGAFRREANKVRRVAISNLRSTGIRTDRDLEKGVRAVVYKRAAGFRVTIGTKKGNRKTGRGERGFHTNRRGLKKPVLLWAEGGTDKRYTKSKTRIFTRSRKGHYTGRMKRYGFMSKTGRQVDGRVTDELREEIVKSIHMTARRYGCNC